jgi:two-component system sensor histidine kinase/response regulator
VESPSKILIIDDEEVVLDSCTLILEGEGCTMATATNGVLGLKQVEEFHPDLVFVDLKMPGMSGMEVIQHVHAYDPSIVSIVITGYATLSSAVEAMQKGAYDFVPKPFTPEEFRLVTRRGVERRKLVLEAAALRREREVLRENFAAIVSHELKSPLAATQQNLFLLTAELSAVLTEDQKTRLDRLKSRIDDLLKMIQTWLRAFTVDIQKIKEGFRPTSVPSVITKAIESVQPFAQRKDIEIVTAIGAPLSSVSGDEGTLVEALVNVVGNAVKYSFAGSQVLVSARHQDGHVMISVSDSGAGIPREELPFIFGDFYRGRTGQAEEAGAGLGLAITRRILEAHGGTISAESTPGKGSTFVMTLPALRMDEETRPAQEASLQRTTQVGGAT